MKISKKITLVAAVLTIVAMMLASCGASLKGDPAVGKWVMTEVEYLNQIVSGDDLIMLGAMTEMPEFIINEDASCTFTFNGESGPGEINVLEDGKYELTDKSGDEPIEFTIKDGKLKLNYTDMDMILIFEQ